MTEGLTDVLNAVEEIQSDADCEIDKQIKELNYDFRDALSDKPDVMKYIERLHTIIRRQQKKLNKFYKKLKDHRFVKKNTTDSKDVQTDTEFNACDWSLQNAEKDIVDEVKEVAENAMKTTSFVYEPTSGMYYDYNTGYYYNAELRMYYDGNTGQYLEYDEETKTYKYHCVMGNEATGTLNYQNSKANLKVRKKKTNYKDKFAKRSKLDEAEEGEITESSLSDSETSESCEDKEAATQESGIGYEPCIRIMVEETNVGKLKVGSLFVVTCKGGTMGREGDHAVLIPDINVSKHHAKFVFDQRTTSYYITDLGSRNGTWLDGERLSAALQESEKFEINHGAVIQIGSTKLLCHVHGGRDTCASCEPGLVQQASDVSVWDPGAKHPEYREQLQNLKKKFGVDAVSQDVYNIPGYEDRAEIRRTTVGSSHPAEKTHTASVNENIPQCNKGFKMLSKMGWSEGQKLGKNESGLAEPKDKKAFGSPLVRRTIKASVIIPHKFESNYKFLIMCKTPPTCQPIIIPPRLMAILLRGILKTRLIMVQMLSTSGKLGLGAISVEKPNITKSARKKLEILKKTQDRYRHIEETATFAESD